MLYSIITKPNVLDTLIIKHGMPILIAPHGCTDLIHAIQNKNLVTFYKLQGLITASSYLINSFCKPFVFDSIFVGMSILHFQRDINYSIGVRSTIYTGFFLFLSICVDVRFLYYYMISIHVPNHYINNWFYIKKTPKLSFAILGANILLCSLFFYNMLNYNSNLIPYTSDNSLIPINIATFPANKYIALMIKSIILTHISYQELFIHRNSSPSAKIKTYWSNVDILTRAFIAVALIIKKIII